METRNQRNLREWLGVEANPESNDLPTAKRRRTISSNEADDGKCMNKVCKLCKLTI